MTLADTWQQREFITATLLGGFRGLGLGNAHHFTEIFASREDGAIAGVMAIYGVPMVCVAIGSYALLMAQPLYNRAVYPSNYLIMSQVSALIFCQVILNFAGSLDLLPFTGVNGPLISAGGSSAICFCVLLGMIAASLHPAVKTKKEE
jgi:cell division protein FtsW (lipid II flippase)